MIRVLRVIEYEYANAEAMTNDMARWTLHSPPNSRSVKFRSAVFMPESATEPPLIAEESERVGGISTDWGTV